MGWVWALLRQVHFSTVGRKPTETTAANAAATAAFHVHRMLACFSSPPPPSKEDPLAVESAAGTVEYEQEEEKAGEPQEGRRKEEGSRRAAPHREHWDDRDDCECDRRQVGFEEPEEQEQEGEQKGEEQPAEEGTTAVSRMAAIVMDGCLCRHRCWLVPLPTTELRLQLRPP